MNVHNDVVVTVTNLVKHYPGTKAVDGISFDALKVIVLAAVAIVGTFLVARTFR